MAISLFDLFKVGIGPSSSHTVGPMVAANEFAHRLQKQTVMSRVMRLRIDLYGSLGATGKGHGTGVAVLMGLAGELPESIDTHSVTERVGRIETEQKMALLGMHPISMVVNEDVIYHRIDRLDFHANGMTLEAFDAAGKSLQKATYYSVGGGFIVEEDDQGNVQLVEDTTKLPYDFHDAHTLIELCRDHDKSIAEIMMANEQVWRSETDIRQGILDIWSVMKECVKQGIQNEGFYLVVLR